MVRSNDSKEVFNYILQIKEDTSAIKEHLRTLNGKVAKHEIDIEQRRIDIETLKSQQNKWLGAFAVIITFATIAINYILK